MMKKYIFLLTVFLVLSAIPVQAAPIPRESVPTNATEEQIVITESLIGVVLDEVQNGLGYADAMAKSNRIIFDAWLSGRTSGYAYGDLVNIANNAIWQYRDMYLRPQFYAENVEKVRCIIADVIEDYKNGVINYAKACFNARMKLYRSVNPLFNSDAEYSIDSCYQDIPSVDNSLFILARKLILGAK